jgi:hypothetical protein
MGILEKLRLKKKKEEDEFMNLGGVGPEMGISGAPGPAGPAPGTAVPTMPTLEPMAAPQMAPPGAAADTEIIKKEIETLSAKLDTLKSTLDNLNARIANMEAIMQSQKEKGSWST